MNRKEFPVLKGFFGNDILYALESTAAWEAKGIMEDPHSSLAPREKEILSYRFGIGKREVPHSLEETSTQFGVTRDRIRQIETKATSKMRPRIVQAVVEALGTRTKELSFPHLSPTKETLRS